MKTYQFNIEGSKHFVKTDAQTEAIAEAIEFVQKGEVNIDKLLQALRILGFKATELKIEPVEVFEV